MLQYVATQSPWCVDDSDGMPCCSCPGMACSLSHMCRFLEIDHCIGSATPSCTGVPEGDSVAVTSMVALGALFHSVMASVPVEASTYVDNFNFCSPSQSKLAEAVDVLEVFTEAWSLTISWDKTWMWGTNKAISDFWKALPALKKASTFAEKCNANISPCATQPVLSRGGSSLLPCMGLTRSI